MSIRSALRELSHKEASLDEIEEFQRQVDDEKNDLGACILMATNVELALDFAVFRVLDWDEDTRASCIRGRAGGHVLTKNSPRPSPSHLQGGHSPQSGI